MTAGTVRVRFRTLERMLQVAASAIFYGQIASIQYFRQIPGRPKTSDSLLPKNLSSSDLEFFFVPDQGSGVHPFHPLRGELQQARTNSPSPTL